MKEKRGHFLYCLFCAEEIFLTFAFNLNVQCIKYTSRIHILLHIKNHYFIHFCCLFLKWWKAFSVSLNYELVVTFALITEIEMVCTIWYHLYNLKNMKNTYGRVLQKVANCATHYIIYD